MNINYSKEYKLKGNEYKFLQYLKVQENDESLAEISDNLNIDAKTLKKIVRILEGLYVIEVERETTKKNKYTINDYGEWNV